jgi:hypothetical protein
VGRPAEEGHGEAKCYNHIKLSTAYKP